MQNLLYDTPIVTSSSPQTNIMQVIIIIIIIVIIIIIIIIIMSIILSHIRICYLLYHLFPSHYILSFDILFFSFLLPAATVIFITGQHSTYLTVLLFLHTLTKRHKALLQIARLSTAHEDWTFQKLCMERDNGQPTRILSICI